LESSGIDRLFTYARELAVETMRARDVTARNEPSASSPPGQPTAESGVRLSLSASATASLEPTAAPSAEVVRPTSPPPTPSDASLRPAPGSAVATYQRNASAVLGGQLAIRA